MTADIIRFEKEIEFDGASRKFNTEKARRDVLEKFSIWQKRVDPIILGTKWNKEGCLGSPKLIFYLEILYERKEERDE